MKSWTALGEAFTGWMKIVRGEAEWERHFALTPAGLTTGLVLYALFAFLSIALASFAVGVPTIVGFVAAMLVQGLSVTALLVGVYGTRMVVPTDEPLLVTLVPGVYALVFYLIVGTALSLVGGPALLFLWVLLAFLLYRLGRVAARWSVGVAAAFSALTLALLVGMPMTLYMLTGPVAAPTP